MVKGIQILRSGFGYEDSASGRGSRASVTSPHPWIAAEAKNCQYNMNVLKQYRKLVLYKITQHAPVDEIEQPQFRALTRKFTRISTPNLRPYWYYFPQTTISGEVALNFPVYYPSFHFIFHVLFPLIIQYWGDYGTLNPKP